MASKRSASRSKCRCTRLTELILEDFSQGAELKVAQQRRQLATGGAKVHVMRQPRLPVKRDAGMIRVQLPRMKVEHDGRSRPLQGPNVRTGEGVGEDAEIGASGRGQVSSQHASHREGKLENRPGPRDHALRARLEIGNAVAPVPYREDARVVAEAEAREH